MDLYIFVNNGDRLGEEIKMVHYSDDTVTTSTIGNIYNLVDYINNTISGPSKLKMVNFTGNKLTFIVKAITKYKSIISNDEYYSLIIDNKKRIRGR